MPRADGRPVARGPVLAHYATRATPATEVLASIPEGAAFALDEESFRWRDRAAGPDELVVARRDRLHSIGSCSFFEPMEELEAMGVLPR